MNKRIKFVHRHIITLLVATFAITTTTASGKEQIFLGPPDSGAASAGASWFTGANGGGYTSVDFNDPTTNGGYDLTLSNTVAGAENNASWRCPNFSLGPAAGGARPITFSFAYKLENPVAAKNNILVLLRFFDSTGTNFIGQRVIQVGVRTGDSGMTSYRTITITGILTPPKARTADIWIDANDFEPWVSGTARFADFSVTTEPRSLLFKMGVGTAVLLGIGALTLLLIQLWRRRAVRNRVAAPDLP
jgi:hypothetical protein